MKFYLDEELKIASRKFNKKWIEDENWDIVEVKSGEKSLKKGEKIGDVYVTGFNPDSNTVYLDEDPEIDGGSDYSADDVFEWKDEEMSKIESLKEDFEDLDLGDKVIITGLGERSPWEGLEGEVIWIDPDNSLEDLQTITVRVNFPTENGFREVDQNFDRRNVKKLGE